jgi:REP element-mobilizing transposase RayT
LVFVTKYRYRVLKGEHIEYLRKVFKETIEEMGGSLEVVKQYIEQQKISD